MPVYKCANGKWKVGKKGRCIYPTKKKAMEVYRAILAQKGKKEGH